MHRRAGARVQLIGRAVGAPALGHAGGAPIHPREQRADRLAGCVDRQHAVHRTGKADCGDLVPAQLHLGQDFANRFHRRGIYDVRVLLDPAGSRRFERIERRSFGHDFTIGRASQNLDRARTEIDPDQQRRLERLHAGSGIGSIFPRGNMQVGV